MAVKERIREIVEEEEKLNYEKRMGKIIVQYLLLTIGCRNNFAQCHSLHTFHCMQNVWWLKKCLNSWLTNCT